MKILHVLPGFFPASGYGGPVSAAWNLIQELKRQGIENSIMTTNLEVDRKTPIDVPLERPVSLDGVDISYFPVNTFKSYYFSPALGRELGRRISSYDLVHMHSIFFWPTTAAAWWCRRKGIPYILHPGGSLDPLCLHRTHERSFTAVKSRLKKQIYLRTVGKPELERAAALHFTTETESEGAKQLGMKLKSFVLPLGVEQVPEKEEPFLNLTGQYPQLKGKKIILYFSRLDPVKGLDILIAAAASLAGKREDFALVIAGTSSPGYESVVREMVRRHAIENRVVFLGPIPGPKKWNLFKQADLFVLPSYHENFGMAITEAMVAGLPVVVSKNVQIYREIEKAGAGLAVDLSPESLVLALERLLSDDELRKQMGIKGAAWSREEFDWGKIASRMSGLYRNIIEGNPL